MLRELNIKNVAVIENARIDFGGGLNVLTGETGAGKSIIIDSINMILGERTSRDYVRYNSEKASVQAVFDDLSEDIARECEDIGAECEDDSLILSRDITSEGKSTARVNGVVVPLATMRTIASLAVNIHGQHDNQALLSPNKHILFLDEFADTAEELREYAQIYKNLKNVEGEIAELSENEKNKTERADLLRYQINEITEASLENGEEEELYVDRASIVNAEKISSGAQNAYSILYENEMGESVYDMISEACDSLNDISQYSSGLADALGVLTDAMYTIEEAAHTIKECSDGVDYDSAVLDDIESRIDTINKLKRKYGDSIDKINEYCKNAEVELDKLDNSQERLEELMHLKDEYECRMMASAKKLSDKRKKAADELEGKITAALSELNMPHAVFGVEIKEHEPTSNGIDEVQFLIRTNGGEPMKPLTKIASGGELSRTMLALKTVLTDSVDTLIFDEIDTGVSGLAAKKIAEKLFEISVGRQVLCITHQPQLASMAEHHYLIEKMSDEKGAKTTVSELSYDGRVDELARITGGDITDTSKNHAKELLQNCEGFKNDYKQSLSEV